MVEQGSHDVKRRLVIAALPPVAAIVVAGLLAPMYSDEPFELGLTVWQAIVLWPLGFLMVGLPVRLLLDCRTGLLRLGQVAVGLLGVVSMVATARSDDAQAGIWLVYPTVFGTLFAAVVMFVSGVRRPQA